MGADDDSHTRSALEGGVEGVDRTRSDEPMAKKSKNGGIKSGSGEDQNRACGGDGAGSAPFGAGVDDRETGQRADEGAGPPMPNEGKKRSAGVLTLPAPS